MLFGSYKLKYTCSVVWNGINIIWL